MTAMDSVLTRRNFCAAGAGLATFGFTRLAGAAEGDAGATITQIAKFKLNMDKEEEGLKTLKELCAAVEKEEPGVLTYICHRSTKNPDEIVFFEIYKDEEAMKAHGKTPHIAKLRAGIGNGLFRVPIEVIRLDKVAGFDR